MQESQAITGWDQIDERHLYFAFRKAKADCFFERSISVAERFSDYERDLWKNLSELLNHVRNGKIQRKIFQNIGMPLLAPKKLSITPTPKDSSPLGHAYFSSPRKAFDLLLSSGNVVPEFRLVGDFPVVLHLLSALWINTVGHKFDAQLTRDVYGSRLRRIRPEAGNEPTTPGALHLEALGSFQPYYSPYRRWRSDGFRAMNQELENNRSVIALSLDIKSYYHRIDPNFLLATGFLEDLGVTLNDWEREFTRYLVDGLVLWGRRVSRKLIQFGAKQTKSNPVMGGVPIGLSAIRVISNVLLHKFDRMFVRDVSPVYYGRYVDDIFVVLRDSGHFRDSSELMTHLASHLTIFGEKKGDLREIFLGSDCQSNSKLELQETKHKVFFLHGKSGADFVSSIEQEIASVNSERRLMPNLEALDRTAAARVLTASGSVAEEADSLRRADGLSVRRLGWSIQLRGVETLARDLRPDDWRKQRLNFYEFATSHILRPDRILDHFDYLPRLVSLAVGLQDWSQASNLVRSSIGAIESLATASKKEGMRSAARINGYDIDGDLESVWEDIIGRLKYGCAEAILRSWKWRKFQPVTLTEDAIALCSLVGLPPDEAVLHLRAKRLREVDWARVSYKDHIRYQTLDYRLRENGEDRLAACHGRIKDLAEFLRRSNEGHETRPATARIRGSAKLKTHEESVLPYLFPTRPYSAQEVALFVPECITGSSGEGAGQLWARLVRAVRGSLVRPRLVSSSHNQASTDPKRPMYDLGSRRRSSDGVRLAITSLFTSDESWRMAASGRSDLSPERYSRLSEIVRQTVTMRPRPTHVLLPELSLPERWVYSVSSRLRDSGVSLVAGLDYYRSKESKQIYSEALLVLEDNRLGYPVYVEIRQRKSRPAPHEDMELTAKFDCAWMIDDAPKPVYEHNGFFFGVLICSELQNINHRVRFQGDVDMLMVVSWNRDLDTFSALVESAVLDVHAGVALSNNRSYGDSRVRMPAKQSFERDLCRVRGGENDYVVVISFNPTALREFQSRAKSWVFETDRFKPLPEGFRIHGRRKVVPR